MKSVIHKFFLITLSFSLTLIVGCVPSISSIKANNARIGIQLTESGRLVDEVEVIPVDAEIIYLEYFLDIPEDSKITLQYNWFHEDKLVQAGTVDHIRGYTIAILDRDPQIIKEFPQGAYRVDVWFLNTKLLSKSFKVK